MKSPYRKSVPASVRLSRVGALETPETKARDKAYDAAYIWVMRRAHAKFETSVQEHATLLKRAAINEGACAGYLFAAAEHAAQS